MKITRTEFLIKKGDFALYPGKKAIGTTKGFFHRRSLPRQIVGMANTMRQEYIVFLQKNE